MHIADVQEVDLTYILGRVAAGETVVLERDGSRIARVTPESVETAPYVSRMAGFGALKGRITVPDDIKTPFAADIEEMFYGNPDKFNR